MSILSIDELSEGMIAKGEVRDPRGRVILEANSIIKTRHIKTFKSWGITSVEICDVDGETGSDKADKAIPESLKEEMSELFQYADPKSEMVMELFKLCVKRRLNQDKGRAV